MPDDFYDILYDGGKKKSGATPYAITGTVLRVRIVAESWEAPGTTDTLDCGMFELDGMDYDDSADGSIANITAVSVPLEASIRREQHSQGWEDTTLREIAEEIAGRGDLALVYELDDDPALDRIDQRQEGDLAFLHRVSRNHGATVKVFNNQIVIFDEAKYEAREPIATFRRGDKRMTSIKLKQDSSNTASSATAAYKDPKSGKLVKETFTPPSAPAVGQALVVNTRPSDLRGDLHRSSSSVNTPMAMSPQRPDMAVKAIVPATHVADDFADIRYDARGTAKQKAKSALREQNKREWICSITAIGNPRMCSGATFTIEGYGVYDGKYIADTVKHTLSATEYTNEIEGHRCLEGY